MSSELHDPVEDPRHVLAVLPGAAALDTTQIAMLLGVGPEHPHRYKRLQSTLALMESAGWIASHDGRWMTCSPTSVRLSPRLMELLERIVEAVARPHTF